MSSDTKIPYPKSIPFILTTEFCERFSYYGMRAILVLFLNNVLHFSETDSSIVFHAFTVLAYTTPIPGAILADSFIGKFNTIFYVSILYALGQMVIVLASVGDTEEGRTGITGLPMTALLFLGLIMVGAGTGGIKPCVATFGGDQFKQPEQKKQSELFFSIFYWAVNLGSFISMLVTPQLRSGVACFGMDQCYPLAFGVPAALMFVAVFFFLLGKIFNMYKINMPDRSQENLIKKTCRSIWSSARSPKVAGETHWLDRGKPAFGDVFMEEVKAVWNVAYMMLPLPIFWALFDQQGSRWTFQATRMNGNFFNLFRLEPDNIQVANAVLILVMIPIFNSAIYPALARCNLLKTSLQRIGVGFFCAALAFFVSGFVDLQLEKTYPMLPEKGFGQLQVYSLIPKDLNPCEIKFHLTNGEIEDIEMSVMNSSFTSKIPDAKDVPMGSYNISVDLTNCLTVEPGLFDPSVDVEDEKSSSLYFFVDSENKLQFKQSSFENKIEKPDGGRPMVKALWTDLPENEEGNQLRFLKNDKENKKTLILDLGNETLFGDTKPDQVGAPADYWLYLNDEKVAEAEMKQGANYNILLSKDECLVHQVTPESSVSMFWQIPQYVIMTAGEILFSVSTMEFCYTQAPVTMKAVTLGLRYGTNAIGNIIDIVVMKAFEGVLPKQAYEFFLFAGLTLVFMAIFIWMSQSYKYLDFTNSENGKSKVEEKTGGNNNEGLSDD